MMKTDKRHILKTFFHSSYMPAVQSGISIVVSLIAASALLAVQSEEPLEILSSFFLSPFTNWFYFGNMCDRAVLILLCAYGFLLPSKIGLFNLGGEGQAYIAALAAVEFALHFHTIPQPFGLITGCLLSFLIAALFGFVSIVLRQLLRINELISSYLLSCSVIPILDYSLVQYLRDDTGSLIATPFIDSAWHFTPLWEPSSLNTSLYSAAVLTICMIFFLRITRCGYELDMIGANKCFAGTQGISTGKAAFLTMCVGAGLNGLAGSFSVYGSQHYVYQGITAGLGWSGMSAALIGRNHPIGVILGAFLFAWIEEGGKAAMIDSTFSFELSAIIQGIVFMVITIEFFKQKRKKCTRCTMCGEIPL